MGSINESVLERDPATGLEIVPLWIDGMPVSPSSKSAIVVHSLSEGRDIYLADSAGPLEARQAADAAGVAFRTWRKTSPVYRRDLLYRVASSLERKTELLVSLQMRETSCSEEWARMNINEATASIREVASRITSISGEIPQLANFNQMALVFKEPLGPILSIAPQVIPVTQNLGAQS